MCLDQCILKCEGAEPRLTPEVIQVLDPFILQILNLNNLYFIHFEKVSVFQFFVFISLVMLKVVIRLNVTYTHTHTRCISSADLICPLMQDLQLQQFAMVSARWKCTSKNVCFTFDRPPTLDLLPLLCTCRRQSAFPQLQTVLGVFLGVRECGVKEIKPVLMCLGTRDL